jgi:predicted enzyme related to lactoylglutathione lyase
MSTGFEGDYHRARVDGRLVAGVGQAPPGSPAGWLSHVRVADVAEARARVERAGGRALASFNAGALAAVVADPSGVLFCLRQAGQGDGVEVADEPNCWAMSSLHTPDLAKAQAFYHAMFGWELTFLPDASFSLWQREDRVVGVVTAIDAATGGIEAPPHWSVNFAVSDADNTADRAVELGGGLVMPPTDTPGFRSAVISDPWGGVFAVSAVSG